MVDCRVADTTLHLNRTVRKRKMYSFVDQRYDAALRTTFAYLPLLLKNEAIIADKLKSKLKKASEMEQALAVSKRLLRKILPFILDSNYKPYNQGNGRHAQQNHDWLPGCRGCLAVRRDKPATGW